MWGGGKILDPEKFTSGKNTILSPQARTGIDNEGEEGNQLGGGKKGQLFGGGRGIASYSLEGHLLESGGGGPVSLQKGNSSRRGGEKAFCVAGVSSYSCCI